MRGAPHLLGSSPDRCVQFCIIAGNGAGRSDPMTAALSGGRKALCVFGFREEAELFLRVCARRGRRAAEIREPVSVLSGRCGEVGLVAPDSLPLLCVDRQRFLGFLLRKVSGR